MGDVVWCLQEDRGGVPFVGSIHFSLGFDFQGQVLTVTVIEARSLAAKDRGGTSDPYVKVLLLPEKKRRQETRVVHKNLNPVWNQSLTFQGVGLDKLQRRILQLMVLDYDKFSRDDPIGEVNVPMCELDFTQPINQASHIEFFSKIKKIPFCNLDKIRRKFPSSQFFVFRQFSKYWIFNFAILSNIVHCLRLLTCI